MRARLEQNVHRLLERASHQRSIFHAIDAVSGDRHQVASARHHVAQNAQVPVIHIRSVKLNHAAQLSQQSRSRRLDAEQLERLHQIICQAPREVDALVAHHLRHVHTLGVEHPLILVVVPVYRVHNLLRLPQKHLLDVLHAAQRHVHQAGLHPLQEIRGIVVDSHHRAAC